MARETGNENNYPIAGTDNPDFLYGLGGDDTLVGRADVDSMFGGYCRNFSLDGDASADITVRINGFSGGDRPTASDFV